MMKKVVERLRKANKKDMAEACKMRFNIVLTS
jgi:hypothetical protein